MHPSTFLCGANHDAAIRVDVFKIEGQPQKASHTKKQMRGQSWPDWRPHRDVIAVVGFYDDVYAANAIKGGAQDSGNFQLASRWQTRVHHPK